MPQQARLDLPVPASYQDGRKLCKLGDLFSLIGLRGRDELGLLTAEIARHVGVTTSREP